MKLVKQQHLVQKTAFCKKKNQLPKYLGIVQNHGNEEA